LFRKDYNTNLANKDRFFFRYFIFDNFIIFTRGVFAEIIFKTLFIWLFGNFLANYG